MYMNFFKSRYQSIRRTITSRAHEDNAASSTPASTSTTVPSSSSPENQRVLLLRSPAVRFLTRPDFLNVLHMNDVSILQSFYILDVLDKNIKKLCLEHFCNYSSSNLKKKDLLMIAGQ